MPMQPNPRAETSNLFLPSVRVCMIATSESDGSEPLFLCVTSS